MLESPAMIATVAGFLSRIGLSQDSRITETKEWIKERYKGYSQGIDEVTLGPQDEIVVLVLSEPLDLDRIQEIAEERGFVTELSEDGILSLFEIIEGGHGRRTKLLRGAFHQRRRIPIDENPVECAEDLEDSRLNILTEYLNRKYMSQTSSRDA